MFTVWEDFTVTFHKGDSIRLLLHLTVVLERWPCAVALLIKLCASLNPVKPSFIGVVSTERWCLWMWLFSELSKTNISVHHFWREHPHFSWFYKQPQMETRTDLQFERLVPVIFNTVSHQSHLRVVIRRVDVCRYEILHLESKTVAKHVSFVLLAVNGFSYRKGPISAGFQAECPVRNSVGPWSSLTNS